MADNRIPTHIWMDGVLKNLTMQATPYYILQKGEKNSGLVMVKVNTLGSGLRLYGQERNFMTDTLEWVNVLDHDNPEEKEIDAYIQSAIQTDPDLWVIEVESPTLENPFEV